MLMNHTETTRTEPHHLIRWGPNPVESDTCQLICTCECLTASVSSGMTSMTCTKYDSHACALRNFVHPHVRHSFLPIIISLSKFSFFISPKKKKIPFSKLEIFFHIYYSSQFVSHKMILYMCVRVFFFGNT